MIRKYIIPCYFLYAVILTLFSCTGKNKNYLFVTRNASSTGLNFVNKLTPTPAFNMFTYMYFYNGAGAGAGDFNNDGLVDLFFASNQGDNKIFLNRGGLQFEDVTGRASIPQDHGWSTGVSVVDINNDGLLDIYICKVGNFESLHGKNQLLVCQGLKEGIPYYRDEASQYGLDFSGFSTQAVFFDYDMDGDLDVFLLNHTVHQDGTFAPRKNFLGTYHPLSGDRLFRNDGDNFTDVTRMSAINSSAISYGLGVAVADINLDGWPDLYAGNDFHENDYLYINQHDGTFSDESEKRMMHTSRYTMGVDVADENNDGFPDIISVDMLPYDPYILKRSLRDDDYDVFYQKINAGYSYQYTRNNLQLNRENGMFSEIGMYAGIDATDWSWAPLFMDFDNDGRKDLFISNGIPTKLNDMDYINFVYTEEMQQKLINNTMGDKDIELTNRFPEIKVPNRFYLNTGESEYRDIKELVKGNPPSFSNGALYADLDNDGDLDIITNNIDEPVLLYENKAEENPSGHFLALQLKGDTHNRNAVGAKVVVFSKDGIRSYENYPVHGFQSSMQVPVHIGLGIIPADSAFLIWPDNTCQPLDLSVTDTLISLTYSAGLPLFDYALIKSYHKSNCGRFEDITAAANLRYKHRENPFAEFNREPLIPHMISTEGPAIAVADINHDGLEDLFTGSSKTSVPAVFLQDRNGTFAPLNQPVFHADSANEETAACWTDVNNDGNPDLVVANGGNEYYGQDVRLTPCVYLNDGTGQLSKLQDAFDSLYINASCVCPYDFNGDGYTDLFIGGRSVPWEYGKIPKSCLLLNDRSGHFKDLTAERSDELAAVGMVTDACWYDIDRDGDADLLVCCEWGGISAFLNQNGRLIKKQLTDNKGWWNFLLPVDIDGDGDIDLVAGNQGLNSRLKASAEEPVRLYYNDFDGNGKKEQVVTFYLDHQEIPFSSKEELQRQIPVLKKKYLYAADFAKAGLGELFSKEKLSGAEVLTADYFSNAVLINDGHLNFEVMAVPKNAQFTPYRAAAVLEANADSLPDILLLGNYYDNTIQMGRNDADFGTLLVNKGKGVFSAEGISGLVIKGQVRKVRPINIKNRPAFVLAMNNDSTRIISFTSPGNKGG